MTGEMNPANTIGYFELILTTPLGYPARVPIKFPRTGRNLGTEWY